MFESLLNSTVIPLLNQVTQFTSARHEVIVQNIANADTPGYRARDVDQAAFERRLKEAVEARDRGRPLEWNGLTALKTTPSPHAGPMKANGNTVSIENEMAALMRNTTRHNAALALLRQQFALIETAIRERV